MNKDSKYNSIRTFSNDAVINLDEYCINALNKEVEYLLSFDIDRLLAGFRETAGLDLKGACRYDGWENTLIGGHTVGHFLSAVAQAFVNKGVMAHDRNALYDIITQLVDGLIECQINSKGKEGFVFGAVVLDPENVEIQFDNIENNRTNITKEAWVPWYTYHKILAGVLEVYKLTGYQPSLQLAKGMGDWAYHRAITWNDEIRKQVLSIEYGGMNDVLYELYKYTENDNYAVAAHCFDSDYLFEKISSNCENALNNYHANTTIPKFMGALNRYISCHNKIIFNEKIDASVYLRYAIDFWEMVVNKHTYVTGGNSEWEHFGKDYILDKERTNCNCETCNIYNMLKLSRNLFSVTGNVKYLHYYEKAFYNSILSSQNPQTGMTTYFQPMSSGYFKVFGQRFDKFWCCTGTGMENFTKLNDSIYFYDEDYVYIGLYEMSELYWESKKLWINIKADLLKSSDIYIKLITDDNGPVNIGLKLRIPDWVDGYKISMVGNKQIDYIFENGFVVINQFLSSQDVIKLSFDFGISINKLPDNERSIAFMYGPYVLSANLGTENMKITTTGVMVSIPADKIDTYDDLVIEDESLLKELMENPQKYMIKDNNQDELSFTFSINKLSFKPHFLRYRERYGIYFNLITESELKAKKQLKEYTLYNINDGKIIDIVQPGYGQYENDELHNMIDWGGSIGSTDGGTSRYAMPGCFFTYRMCVSTAYDNYLSVTFLKEDNGKSIKISSGDEVLYEDVLEYEGDEDSYEIRVKIPNNVITKVDEVIINNELYYVIPITFRGSQGRESAKVVGFIYMMNY